MRRATMQKVEDFFASIERQMQYLGLEHMALRFDELYRSPDFLKMDVLSIIEELVGAQYEVDANKQLSRMLRYARLTGSPAEIGNCVDSMKREYIPHGVAASLSSLEFIKNGLNVCILGPSSAGKSYFSKALAIQSCQRGYRTYYCHCFELIEELTNLKDVNFKKYKARLRHLARLDLLILDDFLLNSMDSESERKVLFDLLEKRNELGKSTIFCSQREPKSWIMMLENNYRYQLRNPHRPQESLNGAPRA
jgi:DNA replication protein DnaC